MFQITSITLHNDKTTAGNCKTSSQNVDISIFIIIYENEFTFD